MQGKVFVSVVQRKPIVRVQNGKDGYYLDEDGLRMELSNEYTARMLLVTGEVNLVNENDLYYLSNIIIKDEFLKKQIVQIDINKDSELLMLTQIGEQLEFGQIKEVGEKFEKLKLYYEKGNSQNQEFKALNLKYKNQIVCIKKSKNER
jgi:cell division protein FtsQ